MDDLIKYLLGYASEEIRVARIREILYASEERVHGQTLDYNDVRVLLAAYDKLREFRRP